MKTTATVAPGVEALMVTVSNGGRGIHAIVTREMLEHLYGDIGKGQDKLLTTFDEHAKEVEALVLDKYSSSLKEPVILHFNEPLSCEPAQTPSSAFTYTARKAPQAAKSTEAAKTIL